MVVRRGGFGPRPTSLGLGVVFVSMHYVYILKSLKDGKFYKGMTDDLRRRMHEHNSGQSKFTRSGRPWKLIYYEAFLVKEDARREEQFLKSGKGKERIKYLFSK